MTDKPGSPDGDADDQAKAGRLMASLQGIDFTSADGRAGLMAVLREIEREAPGAIERLAADIQIKRALRRHPGALASVQ